MISLALAEGGFMTPMDHHTIQRRQHEGRQLADGLGNGFDRF